MSVENSVVAIYRTHTDADRAVKELQRGGVDMHKLSIVGKGYHTDEQVVGYYNTGDRMKYWGKVGAFWGGFWGLLFGSALFMIPGLGPILVAGPLVAWIVAGLEGAVEVGALGALSRHQVHRVSRKVGEAPRSGHPLQSAVVRRSRVTTRGVQGRTATSHWRPIWPRKTEKYFFSLFCHDRHARAAHDHRHRHSRLHDLAGARRSLYHRPCNLRRELRPVLALCRHHLDLSLCAVVSD